MIFATSGFIFKLYALKKETYDYFIGISSFSSFFMSKTIGLCVNDSGIETGNNKSHNECTKHSAQSGTYDTKYMTAYITFKALLLFVFYLLSTDET